MNSNSYPCSRSVGLHLFLLFILISLSPGLSDSQTTPMPTSPAGTNSVTPYVEGSDNGFYFSFNGSALYRYSIPESNTFHGIRAKGNDGYWFLPSNHGGPVAELTGSGKWTYPWDAGVTYESLASYREGDTVINQWKMVSGVGFALYTFLVHISGRTLVIRVEENVNEQMTVQFTLDRCESANSPRIVKIPYLPLFNLLYSNDSFTSFFFDWEKTKCSKYERPVTAGENVSSTSARFTPTLTYVRTAPPAWSRPPLEETIYLTVSPDLSGALPNIVMPTHPAPNVAAAMARTVMFYCPPFTYLQTLGASNPFKYRILDSLHGNNLAVILQWYQFYGMDQKLPDVFDGAGNPYSFPAGFSYCQPSGSVEGKSKMLALRRYVVDTLKYGFALHQNYFEYYPSSPWVQSRSGQMAMLNPDLSTATNYSNCRQERSQIYKPSRVLEAASDWAGRIQQNGFTPTWTYLDVTTSFNPLEWADYDNSSSSPGSSLFTLLKYRELAGIFSKSGPVIGEGGFQFLYAGYFDDFEGRMYTADYALKGVKAPLLVDFELYKIHGKSAQHGCGHCDLFFGEADDTQGQHLTMNSEEILTYIATELAYGHGGLITCRDTNDHTLSQASLEKTHVYPMQIAYATASPMSILYGDQFQTATDYIKAHPGYADIASTVDFMGKVRVQYDNGTIVYVNRSATPWIVTAGSPGGWFSYNTTSHGLNAGLVSNNTFTISPNNGWVCFNPLKTVSGH